MLKVSIPSFKYRTDEILSAIAFTVQPGEHLAVLGESGCGKSTLLHLIYGLLPLKEGAIYWKNERVKGPQETLIPGHRTMKLVAQELNIQPFATVIENIKDHLTGNDEREQGTIEELLQVVGLEPFGNTLVKQLSGGQKQRVALAKALANAPELLLLDEPFSSIDTFRKNTLRRQVYRYLKKQGISCITATHDAEEALMYADQILMLRQGTIECMGTPRAIFNTANTPYQIGFFGEVTLLPNHLFEENEKGTRPLLPHQLKVCDRKTSLQVSVVASYFKGSHYLIYGKWDGLSVFFIHDNPLKINEKVYLSLKNISE